MNLARSEKRLKINREFEADGCLSCEWISYNFYVSQ